MPELLPGHEQISNISKLAEDISPDGRPTNFYAVARDAEGAGHIYFRMPAINQEQANYLNMPLEDANRHLAKHYVVPYKALVGEKPNLTVRHIGDLLYVSTPIEGLNFKDVKTEIAPDGYFSSDFRTQYGRNNDFVAPSGKAFEERMSQARFDIRYISNNTTAERYARKKLFYPATFRPSIMESLEQQVQANNHIGFTGTAQDISQFHNELQQNPELLKAIEKKLAGKGITQFGEIGVGATGKFLRGVSENGHDIVIAIRSTNNTPRRFPLPHHIQPLGELTQGKYHVEFLPMLSDGVTAEGIKQLDTDLTKFNQLGKSYFKIVDRAPRNYGIGPRSGTTYYLDGDGFTSDSFDSHVHPDIKNYRNTPWIDNEGVLTQYKDFKELHEQWNSPLHQAQGKIMPEIDPVYLANARLEEEIRQKREELANRKAPEQVHSEPVAKAREPVASSEPVKPTVHQSVPPTPPKAPSISPTTTHVERVAANGSRGTGSFTTILSQEKPLTRTKMSGEGKAALFIGAAVGLCAIVYAVHQSQQDKLKSRKTPATATGINQ